MLRISVCKRKLTWKNYMLHRKKKKNTQWSALKSNKMHTETVVFLKKIIYVRKELMNLKERQDYAGRGKGRKGPG